MKIVITYMKEEHLDEVAAIENVSFSTPWSRQAFSDSIAADNYCYLVAVRYDETSDGLSESGASVEPETPGKPEAAGHVVGYAGAFLSFEDAFVTNIAVAPEYKRLGIGEKLMESLCDACRKRDALYVHLEVRESNEPAKRMYGKLGFTQDGVRKNFYSKPTEDAILMTKILEV